MVEIAFEKGRISNFDLDLGSGHTAHHRTSLIDVYIHAKFHWSRRT